MSGTDTDTRLAHAAGSLAQAYTIAGQHTHQQGPAGRAAAWGYIGGQIMGLLIDLPTGPHGVGDPVPAEGTDVERLLSDAEATLRPANPDEDPLVPAAWTVRLLDLLVEVRGLAR